MAKRCRILFYFLFHLSQIFSKNTAKKLRTRIISLVREDVLLAEISLISIEATSTLDAKYRALRNFRKRPLFADI
jgi:hypothetical protein